MSEWNVDCFIGCLEGPRLFVEVEGIIVCRGGPSLSVRVEGPTLFVGGGPTLILTGIHKDTPMILLF